MPLWDDSEIIPLHLFNCIILRSPIGEAIYVVIPRNHQSLELETIAASIIRENLIPGPFKQLELLSPAPGYQITDNQDGINLAIIKILQCRSAAEKLRAAFSVCT